MEYNITNLKRERHTIFIPNGGDLHIRTGETDIFTVNGKEQNTIIERIFSCDYCKYENEYGLKIELGLAFLDLREEKKKSFKDKLKLIINRD